MKTATLLLLVSVIVVLGCAAGDTEDSQILTGGGIAIDYDEPEELPITDVSTKETDKTTVADNKEPQYACPDGSWVVDPDECLKVVASEKDVLVFE